MVAVPYLLSQLKSNIILRKWHHWAWKQSTSLNDYEIEGIEWWFCGKGCTLHKFTVLVGEKKTIRQHWYLVL